MNIERAHPLVRLALAPLLGAALVLFLPFVGIALCVWAIWTRFASDQTSASGHMTPRGGRAPLFTVL